jgi:hypothetical protein
VSEGSVGTAEAPAMPMIKKAIFWKSFIVKCVHSGAVEEETNNAWELYAQKCLIIPVIAC